MIKRRKDYDKEKKIMIKRRKDYDKEKKRL